MPSHEFLIGGIMVVSLILYVLFGGADFGAGIWYSWARARRAGHEQHLIVHSIGPIWEANHVWLILVVTLLFTAFPPAYGRITTVLHIPLVLFLLAVVGRGAAFAFRSHDVRADPVHGTWDWLFAVSSILAPVLLGIIFGSLSSERLGESDGSFWNTFVGNWATFFGLMVGFLSFAVMSWLAAIYLWVEAKGPLKAGFRRRVLFATIAGHALALVVLFLTRTSAPTLWENFVQSPRGWTVLSGTGLIAIGLVISLWQDQPRLVRVLAAAEVACMIVGWALGQYPFLVRPDLTLYNAAAPPSTLRFLLGALVGGACLLFPSLYYLYRIFKGGPVLGRSTGA
jgi:cytochrome d ubiquinol oxidase subunit II